MLLAIIGGGVAWYFYNMIYGPAVSGKQDQYTLFIPSNADFDQVMDSLTHHKIIKNEQALRWVAQRMSYPDNIKSGKYTIDAGMNNRELIGKLRLGKQEAVKVVVNSYRDFTKMAGAVGRNLEADSSKLLQLLNDPTYLKSIAYETHTVSSLFLADTYQFNWNTNEEQFVERMQKEYKKFWNDERRKKAADLNLSILEVNTLASIVEEEAYHKEEMPKIAQVYLNRLQKGMLLQADPTVKYAVGDFTIKRVLNKHLETDSPYNTYLYAGLPPGPICLPSKNAIEAVLNPVEHNYLYFCAKDDFSMYHAFAHNLKQHLINARRYQNALNRKRIF